MRNRCTYSTYIFHPLGAGGRLPGASGRCLLGLGPHGPGEYGGSLGTLAQGAQDSKPLPKSDQGWSGCSWFGCGSPAVPGLLSKAEHLPLARASSASYHMHLPLFFSRPRYWLTRRTHGVGHPPLSISPRWSQATKKGVLTARGRRNLQHLLEDDYTIMHYLCVPRLPAILPA